MTDSNEEKQLTLEQQDLEIARLQRERAADALKLAEAQKESERKREERRVVNFTETMKMQIGKSGIVFHGEQSEQIGRASCRERV